MKYWGSTQISAAAGLTYGLVLLLFIPLGQALQLGGDEGMELMKGFLAHEGYRLYSEIWNDQPPLHTLMMSGVFTWLGVSVLYARVLTVLFSSLLVMMLYDWMRIREGHLAAFVTILVWAAWPEVQSLSVSVMLELPAMTMGLASLWILDRFGGRNKLRYWGLSGLLMGLAMELKWSAALLGPACVFEMLRMSRRCSAGDIVQTNDRLSKEPTIVSNPAIISGLMVWAIGLLLGLGGVLWLCPERFEAISLMLQSHFSQETQHFGSEMVVGSPIKLILREYGLVFPAVLGIAGVISSRKINAVMPVVLFFTALLVHIFHRPFWHYYSLHFAIPGAWLAGLGVAAVWRLALGTAAGPNYRAGLQVHCGVAGLALLLALLAIEVPKRIVMDFRELMNSPRIDSDPVVNAFLQNREDVNWIFTDRVIYAFHARLPVPPELAVTPRKRFWSGQLDRFGVLDYLKHYKPERIYFRQGSWSVELQSFLLNDYRAERLEFGVMYFRMNDPYRNNVE